MGYAQRELYNQLGIIGQKNQDAASFKNFDVNNISSDHLGLLRQDVYGGYKKKMSGSPRFEMRGAGSGRRSVQTGYHAPGTSFSYYNSHPGWSKVRDKLGIGEVNNTGEISRMYDFVNGYQAPAPAAATPAAAPAPLMPQISAASQKYQADAQALSDKIAQQQADFNASQAAAAKAKAIASANQARSGQTANLQIQPASSTPKTAGTQAFKKRNLLPTSKRRLTSGINLGTSNTLNI